MTTNVRSVKELSDLAAAAFALRDFQTAARLFAECRTNVETADPSSRVVQLDDGRLALCTRAELEACAGHPDNVNALHNHLRKQLEAAKGAA